jgi:predicted membrane protein
MEDSDKDKGEVKEDYGRSQRRGGRHIWLPIGLVIIGGGMFLRQAGLGIPEWIFSWQMLLVVLGIVSGLSHGFRGPGWLIMILIGSFFMMDQLIPGIDLHKFLWPVIIVVVGLVMLIRPRRPHFMDHDWQGQNCRRQDRWRRHYERKYARFNPSPNSGEPTDTASGSTGSVGSGSKGFFSSEDFIDATTVFGGLHKNILSKNFRGGDITLFMAGAEINLSQADIQGTAVIDITQVMGGTKIIVPSHWEVRSQVSSVFGNLEDKRQNRIVHAPDKVLIIDGTTVFGGIEIRNF